MIDGPDQYALPPGLPDAGPKRIKILALSGGGYRGVFSARLLWRLEQEFCAGRPIGECFDLIAGTSVGGLIGTALSLGTRAETVAAVLLEHGSTIFPSLRFRKLRKVLGGPPFKPEHLRAAIDACITRKTAQTALAQHAKPLLLTAVHWNSATLHLLGSQPTPYADKLGLTLADAMLATSAAPSYFPEHRVAGGHVFLDGGLAANAPDTLALECAQRMWPSATFTLLSVGTANPLGQRNPNHVPSRAYQWAVPAIEISMYLQEQRAIAHCQGALGTRYVRLNAHPSHEQAEAYDFDVATPTSTAILTSLADTLAIDQIANHRARLAMALQ